MRKLDKEWTDRVLYPASCVGSFNGTETRGRVLPARDIRAGPKDEKREQEKATVMMLPPNGSRLSCGRPARRRKVVGRSPCPARGTTLRFLKAITARRLQALVRRPATLLALSSRVRRRSANAGSAGPRYP